MSLSDRRDSTDAVAAIAVGWVGTRTLHDVGILKMMARVAITYVLNAFHLGVADEHVTRAGLFEKACRINHSCCPNAVAAWNEQRQRLTVHAVRPILWDEEVTISYLDETLPQDDRQALLGCYGFRCKCPACDQASKSYQNGFYHRSAARRAMILRLEADLEFLDARCLGTFPLKEGPISPNVMDENGKPDPVSAASEICYLMEEENWISPRSLRW